MTDNIERRVRKQVGNEVERQILDLIIEPVRQQMVAAFSDISQVVNIAGSVFYGAYWPLEDASTAVISAAVTFGLGGNGDAG